MVLIAPSVTVQYDWVSQPASKHFVAFRFQLIGFAFSGGYVDSYW